MMRRRLSAPPRWFWALVLAAWIGARLAGWLDWDEPAGPSLAFFGWLILLGHAIWTGIQAIGQATLAALAWSVHALWAAFQVLKNGLIEAARGILTGLRKSWEFLDGLYRHVLVPAWEKFWRFIDWSRATLDRVFRPVFKFLFRVRAELLKFYDRFVRPVLDTIGVARKILRVFSTLGIDWAKKLDAKLGQIEEKIDASFRLLLRELNKVINLVNRVVTADGLFQRLALFRSFERDFAYLIHHSFRRMVRERTAGEKAQDATKFPLKTPAEDLEELTVLVRDRQGRLAAPVEEAVADLQLMLRRGR